MESEKEPIFSMVMELRFTAQSPRGNESQAVRNLIAGAEELGEETEPAMLLPKTHRSDLIWCCCTTKSGIARFTMAKNGELPEFTALVM